MSNFDHYTVKLGKFIIPKTVIPDPTWFTVFVPEFERSTSSQCEQHDVSRSPTRLEENFP